jgi:pyruvate,water dikinase
VGEDLQASFAGQFESQLNVIPDNWFTAYKQVLASKYSAHAIYYRMSQGFTDAMTPMAVLVMPTIPARVSGILYTQDQNRPDLSVLYMVSGTGEKLAAGTAYQGWAQFDIKQQQVLPTEAASLLPPEILRDLFSIGQELEKIFGTPQDVEWLVDQENRIFVVQSRPLRMSAVQPETRSEYPGDMILARGQWVSSGQVSGRIYHLKDPAAVSEIPDQTILVTRELPPELTLALSKVRGVLAEHGSPACHFASVARETGIPVICNVDKAGDLDNGQTVSLDSDQGVILKGRLFDEKPLTPAKDEPGTPVRKKLSEALAHISPLSLENPGAEEFSVECCRSLHDIVRYVHEAGVREMFSLVGRRGIDSYGAKRLNSGLPLVMHVLDVAQGLSSEGKSSKEINLKDVNSQPMQQLFKGLGSPAVKWDSAVLHYDWMAYAQSTANFINVEKSAQFSSYAIVDHEYLHALLRFGYHFAVVDAIQSPEPEQNYIHFSFKGGGGNEAQRFFRVQLIQTALAHFLFSVHTAADLLEASFDRRSSADTGRNLARLGIILGKTVLLDMRLKNEEHVQTTAETMIQEAYDFFPVQENP